MQTNRLVSGSCAGASWVTAATTAATDINIRLYLLILVATCVTSIWALVEVWIARPDHTGLAMARIRLYEAKLNGALEEEHTYAARQERKERRYLNRVV
ncbi:hypothetical protein [Streptosporangium sandarakinum]